MRMIVCRITRGRVLPGALGALAASLLLLPAPGALRPLAAQEQPVLRIATEGAFPPFNLVDDKGEPAGFEVDLGRALCAAMKVSCTFVLQEWEGMSEGLRAGRYDAVMSSMANTRERRFRMSFSKPYYLAPAAFIARRDAAFPDTGPAALKDKTIGAPGLTEHAAYLEDLYKGSDIRLFGTLEEAGLDLLSGRLDLVLGDKLALSRFLASREGACCQFVADARYHPAYHGFGVAVALRRGDLTLRERFDAAIDAVIADGTYDRIRARHLPVDVRFPGGGPWP
jgi:polar amino acid transport system substrate-binding protein